MKGLLIKDFRLIRNQKRFFVLVFGLAVVMAFFTDSPSFLVGYLSFVVSLFSLSTISYDEFDNGNAFLFTLPISRKGYVAEKYCFSLLLSLGSMLAGVLLCLLYGTVKDMGAAREAIAGAPAIFALVTLFLAIILPMQMKFGAEKARIALAAVAGGVMVAGFAAVKLSAMFGSDLLGAMEGLAQKGAAALLAGGTVILAAALLVSMKICVGIMEKKEF